MWPVCVAVGEQDIARMVDLISTSELQADFIEFRLDYLEVIDFVKLEKLLEKMKIPFILTVRRNEEGGKFQKDKEEERKEILKRCVELRPDFIDIELSSPFLNKDLVDFVKMNEVKIIGSYHSFQDTPPIHVLSKKIDIAYRLGLDVVKIVTYANEIEDNLTILSLHSSAQMYLREMEIVAFCMGELGLISRVLCPLFGSKFTFASLGEPTAPGQISLQKMKQIQELL
ncbi:MAG: type I 3-dehydroquinate dehydratase [Candidatus Sifarchaeia archaeon]|jgi:3-dehydroquinate dehydratase type I